jgi:hypothetical protein
MKWVEQIILRSSSESLQELDIDSVIALANMNRTPRPNHIKVYKHGSLETDLSVFLCWATEQPEPLGSSVARHISQQLSNFGLVNSSWWIETLDIV